MTALAAVPAVELPAPASANHAYETQWGSYGTDPGQFNGPGGLDTDGYDNVHVADYANNRVQKFSPDGELLGTFGSFGTADGQLNHPVDVAVNTAGNVWVADQGNNRIQKFDGSGACKKQTRKKRKKRACTLFAAIGKLSQPGAAGRNTLRFSGKLGARKLKRGLYRATAVATGASGKSRPATAKFAVSR